jgi:hypothetical protein
MHGTAGNVTAMTSQFPRRSVSKGTALLAVAVSALFVLTGCTKPLPGATVFSGTSSENRQATCWAFNADELGAGDCAQDLIAQAADGNAVSVVSVVPGETVGISVDPAVAETGWYVVLGNQRMTTSPIQSFYYRFTFPETQEIPAEGILLQIVASTGIGARGIWVFKLEQAT